MSAANSGNNGRPICSPDITVNSMTCTITLLVQEYTLPDITEFSELYNYTPLEGTHSSRFCCEFNELYNYTPGAIHTLPGITENSIIIILYLLFTISISTETFNTQNTCTI